MTKITKIDKYGKVFDQLEANVIFADKINELIDAHNLTQDEGALPKIEGAKERTPEEVEEIIRPLRNLMETMQDSPHGEDWRGLFKRRFGEVILPSIDREFTEEQRKILFGKDSEYIGAMISFIEKVEQAAYERGHYNGVTAKKDIVLNLSGKKGLINKAVETERNHIIKQIEERLDKPVKINSHKCESWNDDDTLEEGTGYIDKEDIISSIKSNTV